MLSGMQDAVMTAIWEAEALIEQGQAAAAIARLRQMVEQRERENEPDARVMATLYHHLGLAYRAEVQMSHAQACWMRAYEYTRAFVEFDRLAAVIARHFGELCRWQGLMGEAVYHLGQAYEYFSKAAEPQDFVATLLQVGLTYEAMSDFEVAKRYYFRALSICQTEQLPLFTREVRQQYAVSVLGKQDVPSAVEELLRCVNEYRTAGDVGGEAQTYARIGAVYLQHGFVEEVGLVLEQALGVVTDEMATRDLRLPEVYQVQAQYLMKRKKYMQAAEYSERASELYAKMGLELASVDALKISAQARHLLQSRDSMKRAMEWLEQNGSLDPW